MRNCNRVYTDKNCNLIIDDDFDNNYVYIYIIKHTTSSGTSTHKIILREKESDLATCSTTEDGYYSICKIDVPLDPKEALYYYKDGRFYKMMEEVNIQELICVNPEVSKLKFEYFNYFCLCRLWRCYVNVCQEIFDQRASVRCDTTGVNSALTYKRDLLNSTINVINYMVDLCQYLEAQRLLERISGCNGLCNTVTNTNSCGCMQM